MRDKRSPTILFRQLLREIALLMGYEITRNLPVTTERIETPLTAMEAPVIAGKKVAIVSILRAGLGMADGLQDLIPSARMGHIGLYRDPQTKRPVEYFVKLPEPEGRTFIICDPMLATGHSAVAAVDILNRRGVSDDNIRFLALVDGARGHARLRHRPSDDPRLRRRRSTTTSTTTPTSCRGWAMPAIGCSGRSSLVTWLRRECCLEPQRHRATEDSQRR